jgi:large subunit ribosomal protein L9
MEVILLERIGRLGHMGDVVRVKDGFARNFLLPKGKALRATKENKAKFEGMKGELEARNVEMRGEAQKIGGGLDGKSFVVLRQASETGQLYGSVSGRDVAVILNEAGFQNVTRGQIALNAPIKTIGLHKVPLALHPEVEITISINVARSADEAERIARGEDVIGRRGEAEEGETVAAAAFFENPPEDGEEAETAAPAAAPADEAKAGKAGRSASAAADETRDDGKAGRKPRKPRDEAE